MSSKVSGLKNRIASMFIDREFFMRSNGHVKFLKISAKLQRIVAAIIVAVIFAWIAITLIMATNQYGVALERMALVKEKAKVESAEERVASYKDSIEKVATDLSKRQDLLDESAERYFNADELQQIENDDVKAKSKLIDKVGAVAPGAKALANIETRQIAFAQKITKVAQIRAKRAEEEIRKLGLSPKQFVRNDAQGGPFIPYFNGENQDPRFAQMASALAYMHALEEGLNSVPSAMPAASYKLSSAFGYRRDPITGGGAMHSGLDFKSSHGTPILAAADGIITKAGWMGGYGKTIEITHGNGLMTRYAHMSRLTAKVGQAIDRGNQIGRMGSTGRSTGTHLHFEVRHNGRAINPRKFLEANTNVLKDETNTKSSAQK